MFTGTRVPFQAFAQFESVYPGEAHIHDHYLRLKIGRFLEGLKSISSMSGAIPCLTDDLLDHVGDHITVMSDQNERFVRRRR